VLQHLDESDDREVTGVGDEVRPLGLHPVAPKSEGVNLPDPFAQVTQELTGVEITRGLAAGNQETGSGWTRHARAVYGRVVPITRAAKSSAWRRVLSSYGDARHGRAR
jgi:hypothetical protein